MAPRQPTSSLQISICFQGNPRKQNSDYQLKDLLFIKGFKTTLQEAANRFYSYHFSKLDAVENWQSHLQSKSWASDYKVRIIG